MTLQCSLRHVEGVLHARFARSQRSIDIRRQHHDMLSATYAVLWRITY